MLSWHIIPSYHLQLFLLILFSTRFFAEATYMIKIERICTGLQTIVTASGFLPVQSVQAFRLVEECHNASHMLDHFQAEMHSIAHKQLARICQENFAEPDTLECHVVNELGSRHP